MNLIRLYPPTDSWRALSFDDILMRFFPSMSMLGWGVGDGSSDALKVKQFISQIYYKISQQPLTLTPTFNPNLNPNPTSQTRSHVRTTPSDSNTFKSQNWDRKIICFEPMAEIPEKKSRESCWATENVARYNSPHLWFTPTQCTDFPPGSGETS